MIMRPSRLAANSQFRPHHYAWATAGGISGGSALSERFKPGCPTEDPCMWGDLSDSSFGKSLLGFRQPGFPVAATRRRAFHPDFLPWLPVEKGLGLLQIAL